MKTVNPALRYFARLLVGTLFLVSGFGKLLDVENFGNLIVSYGFFWSALLAPAIVVLELGLGLALVMDVFPRICSWISIGLLALFTGAFFYGNVVNGIEDCGCFGNLDLVKLPVWATYARNALLLLLLIAGMEKNADPKPDLFRSGVLAVGVAAALFVSGYTFEPPQSFRERMPRQHPLIHMDVADTPIPQFIQTSPDSTYTLYVFSFSCVSCINGLPALREYQDSAICDKVIGLAVNEDKDNAIHSYYDFNFPVVYVGNAMSRFTDTVPTLLYIRNNRIEFVVEGGVPSSWWFRKGYLENL